MAQGTSLPSDFTPIPQVLLPYARQAFVARSNKVLGQIVGGAGAPVELVGDPGFSAGGQYLEGPTMTRIVSANRRDITSVSAITADKLAGVNNRGVAVQRRSNLVDHADDTYIAGRSREQVSAELGAQLGEVVADDMCSMIIAALVGIVEAVGSSLHTSNVWSASVRTNLSADLIDAGRFLMGDRMDQITHMICRSEANRDLRSEGVGRSYDAVGGLMLQGADNQNQQGLIKAIRDDASLTVADAGFNKAITLLLGAGVLKIGFVKPVEIETIRVINLETKKSQWRADWDMFVQCPHMEYDATGGANPTNTTLGTAASWTDNMTSAKEMALVELIHNASAFA